MTYDASVLVHEYFKYITDIQTADLRVRKLKY
jgi:hypothetical protein